MRISFGFLALVSSTRGADSSTAGADSASSSSTGVALTGTSSSDSDLTSYVLS